MDIKSAIAHIVARRDLKKTQMASVMKQIVDGACSQAQVAAILIGLAMKGESIDEIVGAVEVLRKKMLKVKVDSPAPILDIVGTGGDQASLFNVSTAAAFVVAAAGGVVAKHGNRSISSKSGSVDLLEKVGICTDLEPDQISACIEKLGIGFMYAPLYHPAMKKVASVRAGLGIRTLFNLLGPLTNPANVQRMLIGVYHEDLCFLIAEVLKKLGVERAWVVHSADGLDEISIAAKTQVVEVCNDNKVRSFTLNPEDFGLAVKSLEDLTVASPDESLALIETVFTEEITTPRLENAVNLIALNAGAGLYLLDCASDIHKGFEMAKKAIASGSVEKKISMLSEFTNFVALSEE